MKTQLSLPYTNINTTHLHSLIICLLFISACSVLKEKSFFQADSLLRRNSSTEIKKETQTQTQAVRIYSSEDSADKQSYTEIFPEGVFKYSVKDGFEGKAGRLRINERLREGRKVRDSAGLMQAGKMETKMKMEDRSSTRNRVKEKVAKANNWNLFYLGGIVLLFVGVYWGRRYLQEDKVSGAKRRS